MNDFCIYTAYLKKTGGILNLITKSPKSIFFLTPIVALPELTTTGRALYVLAVLFIVDFITGITAGYLEFKKTNPTTSNSNTANKYFIQSTKLRLSVIKFITYSLSLLVANGIEWAFIEKEFKPHNTLNTMTLTTIVIGFLCIVEIYSIVFENFKKMGFDVLEVIKKISDKCRDIYRIIKI